MTRTIERPFGSRRNTRGFTLIEILVVISIIVLLVSMIAFALSGSYQHARIARTKGTIRQINEVIMTRWDQYETRRVPIDTANLPAGQAATRRLSAMREIMRMEFPDRWSDVTTEPELVRRTAPSVSYLRRYQNSRNRDGEQSSGHDEKNQHQNAECLYMILTTPMGGEESARDQFGPGMVADTDDDGFPEIIDGWGNPIRFIRWAPGFSLSLLQLPPEIRANPSQYQALKDSNPRLYSEYHDPLDYAGVDPRAFRLVPLIYSAGSNEIYDIYYGQNNDQLNYPINPYDDNMKIGRGEDLTDFKTGAANGKEDWWDNIHNHGD
jgi:prepilin-type N-terminal cleavage/methylation domain-containing protein